MNKDSTYELTGIGEQANPHIQQDLMEEHMETLKGTIR